jgi:hypothetical protein
MINMLVVEEINLSRAWGKALIHIVDHSGHEITPLVISINKINASSPLEDLPVREVLDNALGIAGIAGVQTVANTIFPESLWRIARGDRQKLFTLYKNNLGRYKKLEPILNRRGLYFERLIDFGFKIFDGNQLEYIISSYNERDGVRRSKFQASIFDPFRDHVPDARLGFPCLQHISFVPIDNNLTLNAFYATQLLFEKAYGNLFGLMRLGNFMASQMRLNFTEFTCVIGVEKLGVPKKNVRDLAEAVRGIIL